jgi:hypothetical protein
VKDLVLHQLQTIYKEAYNSVRSEVFSDILIQFVKQTKLFRLSKGYRPCDLVGRVPGYRSIVPASSQGVTNFLSSGSTDQQNEAIL